MSKTGVVLDHKSRRDLTSETGSKYTTVAPSTTTSKRNRRAALGSDEFMAAAIGDTAWLRQSLKSGKDPNSFDKNGLSAIHLAALHGRIECLKLLVEKYHVSVNLASSTHWRPIHLCINSRTGKRALECMVYLLDMGADPSVANEDLMTPSHQAAIEGSVKCLEILLSRGADISKPDNNGHLPLDYAKIWGHRKCARILASETWKREKESEMAKVSELQQLKNLKDAVDTNEHEDQQAYRDILVDETFHEWLESKGLGDQSSPRSFSHKKDSMALGVMANQLYQTNSKRKASQGPKVKIQPAAESPVKGKMADMNRLKEHKIVTQAKGAKKEGGDRMIARERLCKGKKKPPLEPVKKVKVPVVEISGHPLSDKSTLITHRVPDLSQEVIDRILLEKLSPHERPLSFKCKNIIDSQHKRLYEVDAKPGEEIYAHISNDAKSMLFPKNNKSASSHSSRSSNRDSFDNRRIADALKHVARPNNFPQIQGEDFTYAFEVL